MSTAPHIVSGTSFGTGDGTHFTDQNRSSKGRRGTTWPGSVQWFRSFGMLWWAWELDAAGRQEDHGRFRGTCIMLHHVLPKQAQQTEQMRSLFSPCTPMYSPCRH